MWRPKTKAICILVLLALVPFVAIQATVNSSSRAPASYLSLNGFRLAERSLNSIEQFGVAGDQIQFPQSAVRQARQAFEAEPLATDALFMQAFWFEQNGEPQRARDIAERAAVLDKRNQLINLYLLQGARQTGGLEQTIVMLDRVLTVHPESAEFLMPALMQVLENLNLKHYKR